LLRSSTTASGEDDEDYEAELQQLEKAWQEAETKLRAVFMKHALQLAGCLNTMMVSELVKVHKEVSSKKCCNTHKLDSAFCTPRPHLHYT
jgi:hypothetical protein